MDKKRYNHEWYLKNKERVNKANREWYQKNKESVLARQNKWRKENLEEDRRRKQIYGRKNRKKLSIHYRKWTSKKRDEIKILLGEKCSKCSFDDKRALHIHHKTPKTKTRRLDFLAKGYDLSKVELVCANCHAIEHYEFFRTNNKKYA